jgi:eukaryotic-like serine/threonine-protein kinase
VDPREIDRLRAIDALFAEALGLEGEERVAFLAACPDGLRGEVEELLGFGADENDPGVAPSPLGGSVLREVERELARSVAPATSLAGERAGPFELTREIGRGGMSVVYLAQRVAGGFEQTVAVKLVPGATGDERTLRRFDRERGILADLVHPSIARLHDGGVTSPHGLAYLTMEWIDGLSIDRHCRERKLDLDARLELFLQAARAVQFAHRRLVVHRDLKPSNILVDTTGAVKLLDFGIAMLLPTHTDRAALTTSAERFLTLEFASPEQFRGEPVTTASDVYQLGLVLYELLADRRAYVLAGRGFQEVERLICAVDPPPPSAAGGPLRIGGELDDITLLALRKEPDRRYGSVAELIDDLERFRSGLPVRARPATAWYQARKLAGRHRLAFGAAVALLCALTLGLAGTAWQAREASAARDVARLEAARLAETERFLVALFQDADPRGTGSLDRTVGDLLDAGVDRLRTGLDDQPELKISLLDRLGLIYRELGAHDRASPLVAEALRLRRQHDEDAERVIAALHSVAAVQRQMPGEQERAIAAGREALGLAEEVGGPREIGLSCALLAESLIPTGALEEAERLLVRATALLEPLSGAERDRFKTSAVWALLEQSRGRFEEAENHLRAALALSDMVGDESPLAIAYQMANLGKALSAQGRSAEAATILREALTTAAQRFAGDSAWHASIHSSLAVVLADLGDQSAAEQAAHDALRIYEKVSGPTAATSLTARLNLGYARYRAGRFDQAIVDFSKLIEREEQAGIRDSVRSAMARFWLGRALIDSGQPAEAVEPLTRAHPVFVGFYGPADALAFNAELERAIALSRSGAFEAAREQLAVDTEGLDSESLESARRALAELVRQLETRGETSEAAVYGERLGRLPAS